MNSDTSETHGKLDSVKRTSNDESVIVSGPASIDREMLTERVKARMTNIRTTPSPDRETDRGDSHTFIDGMSEVSGSGIPQSLSTRIPVIRQLWTQIRRMLFDEVRTYVDGHFARQAGVNQKLVETVAELKNEITDLRAAIERSGSAGK